MAIISWNPKRQKNCSCLPPTWIKEELGIGFAARYFSLKYVHAEIHRSIVLWYTAVKKQEDGRVAICLAE